MFEPHHKSAASYSIALFTKDIPDEMEHQIMILRSLLVWYLVRTSFKKVP